jgi:hypothetical protein
VVNADKAFTEEVRAKTNGLESKWVGEAKTRGLADPVAVLKEYRALIAGN